MKTDNCGSAEVGNLCTPLFMWHFMDQWGNISSMLLGSEVEGLLVGIWMAELEGNFEGLLTDSCVSMDWKGPLTSWPGGEASLPQSGLNLEKQDWLFLWYELPVSSTPIQSQVTQFTQQAFGQPPDWIASLTLTSRRLVYLVLPTS